MKEHLQSKTQNIKKVHSQGPRSNAERSVNENDVAGCWEGAAAYEMMLTYSWLMALVVFSKGHEADSDGLKTGSNGWSELEGRMGKKAEIET